MTKAESILIVDDRAENLRLLSLLLGEQGYRVRVAPDGAQALASVEKALPDLVLLDVMMPEMDGYEVCRRLKARHATSAVPVIFLSALSDVRDKVRALEAGGVDYIAKPFQSEEVLARIETHLALERARASLERRNRQLVVLSAFSRALQRCPREADTHDVVTAASAQLLPGISGELLASSGDGKPLAAVASWGAGRDPAHRPTRLELERALDHGPDISPASSDEGLTAASYRVGFSEDQRTLLIPIGSPEEEMGALALVLDEPAPGTEPGKWDDVIEQHGAVLTQLVDHLTVSVRSLRLRERLRLEAIVDPLTGLFNRRHMEAVVAREAYRARRREKAVGLVMCDIDRFKRTNDTHGHDAGDAILRRVGALLLEGTRGEDIACRYGGEEFLLILPEIDPEVLRRRTEGLLARTRESSLEWEGAQLRFTLSAGMAVWSGERDFQAAIRAADAALYRAKEGGRDRAVGP